MLKGEVLEAEGTRTVTQVLGEVLGGSADMGLTISDAEEVEVAEVRKVTALELGELGVVHQELLVKKTVVGLEEDGEVEEEIIWGDTVAVEKVVVQDQMVAVLAGAASRWASRP